MKFALILAGGTGERMGNSQTPKQFLLLDKKAILLHTLEKFYLFRDELEQIVIATPASWISYTTDLIHKNFEDGEAFFSVIAGGDNRNETVKAGVNYICETFETSEHSIVLTHDAVRPFISYRIIRENIDQTVANGAVDTVIPCIDTIVYSEDTQKIADIPERAKYYQGQTPQSFRPRELQAIYNELTAEQLNHATDVAKLYRLLGKDVYLVQGEQTNFKITTPFDLNMAKALLENV